MNAPTSPHLAVPAIPVDQIVPSPTNPRRTIDEAYLAELATSIKAHGVIQPITVRPNPDPRRAALYEIVVGECRWRAAKLAGLTEIPGFWRDLDDRQVLEIQVIENLQRRDIHHLEEAEGYARLIERHGYTGDAIAEKIGKSRSYVYGRLKLTALHAPAREAFLAGKMGADTALLIARIPGAALQKKATKEVTQSYNGEPMTFRAAKDHIRYHFTVQMCAATWPLDDAALVPAAGSCAACPKRSVNSPELCADLGGTDICTDPQCFDDKRAARHLQRIELAEARGIPVLTGDAVKDVAVGGQQWNLDRTRYVDLDESPDAGDKTYRELLGDAAPVAAVIEFGNGTHKRLVEVAEPKALAQALRAAGVGTQVGEDDGEDENDADQALPIHPRSARQAERDAHRAAPDAEKARRAAVWARVSARLQDGVTPMQLPDLLCMLAAAYLRRESELTDLGDSDDWLRRWGFELPDEFNAQEEVARISAALRGWGPGRILGFLFDDLLRMVEIDSNSYYSDLQPPSTLLELCGHFGLDAAELDPAPEAPETAADPTPAAQAQASSAAEAAPAEAPEDGNSLNTAESETAEANPAPAAPANETPPDAWPFPTEWPQANPHGVYDKERAEAFRWRSGKCSVTVYALQIGRAMWISSVSDEWKTGSTSEPLTMQHHFTQPTRQDALAAAADRAMDRLLGPEEHGLTAAQKKSLRAWLKDLAEGGA